ncbi:MAG: PEP-CTERM sorting domain-containing protein [Candidatus Omnitrophica bacterium]|nr:PEP-CTERM sorting domain-containing protein [Candidatus Omnitrophota bacterium]
MKKLLIIIAAFVLIAGFSVQASAIPVAVGDPVEGNSWTQRFYENSVGNYNWVGIWGCPYNTSTNPNGPNVFEAIAQTNFDNSGWSGVGPIPTPGSYSYASGPTTSSMAWDIHFTGNMTDGVEFLVMEALDCQMKGRWYARYSNGWYVEDWTSSSYDYLWQSNNGGNPCDPIPEPATMMLLGSLATGLFGAAGIRRKMR